GRVSSFVPVDPCQPVIAALRLAMQEHLPRAYIDREVEVFRPHAAVLPDPYALKQLPVEAFATATLPVSRRPEHSQHRQRLREMALRLRHLERQYESVLFVCSISDWPWVRDEFLHAEGESDDAPAVYEP